MRRTRARPRGTAYDGGSDGCDVGRSLTRRERTRVGRDGCSVWRRLSGAKGQVVRVLVGRLGVCGGVEMVPGGSEDRKWGLVWMKDEGGRDGWHPSARGRARRH